MSRIGKYPGERRKRVLYEVAIAFAIVVLISYFSYSKGHEDGSVEAYDWFYSKTSKVIE